MTKATPPRRNLPPGAEAWGRYVDKRLDDLQVSDSVHRINVGASIQAVASSSHHLGEFKRGTEYALGEVAERLEQLDEDLEVVGNAFTTSESPPTPEDAEGKPEGAYWTQIDIAGEQIARWRLDDGVWVDAPLGMTFIPEIGTDKIIASEAGFDTAVVNQLFARNIGITGELTALGEDFTTILSQAGVQMFANNSLVYEGDWTVPGGDPGMFGGWPGRLAVSGDRIMAVPTEDLDTPYAAYLYNLEGTQQGSAIQPTSGRRFFELAGNSSNFFAITNSISSSSAPRSLERWSRVGTFQSTIRIDASGGLRMVRIAALDDGNIAVAYVDFGENLSYIDLVNGTNGNLVGRIATFPDTTGLAYVAASGGYVYAYLTHLYAGAPSVVHQYTTSGDFVRDIHLPGYLSSLSARGDVLWAGVQQVGGLLMGYDTETGTPRFVGRLRDREDLSGGIQAPNGDIYGIPSFWEGSDAVVVRRHSLSTDPHIRVSIDNIDGELIAHRGFIERLEAHEIHAPANTKTVAYNLVSGSYNVFQSLAEANAALLSPHPGTRILVQGVEYIYRGGQWEPSNDVILLDDINMSGNNRDPIREFTIPPNLVGAFRRYVVSVKGGLTGSSDTRPFLLRFNGDSGENYRASCYATQGNTLLASSQLTGTAFPRVGYMGNWEGHLNVNLHPRRSTNQIYWSTTGWVQNGNGNNYTVAGGGLWVNSGSGGIETIQLLCSAVADTWNSNSSAQLWGYR